MPENGIDYMDRKDLLSFEESERLIRIFADLGVSKIRITGGEPFVRKGLLDFLKKVKSVQGIDNVSITTNGTLSESKVENLLSIGIHSVNLSLDSLDAERFFEITRRNEFDKVYTTLMEMMESSIDLKINMVVMDGLNIEDIYPMIELGKESELSVRFIEQMPFNGSGRLDKIWTITMILDYIKKKYPEIIKLEDPANSTSSNYQIPGFKGSFGIIAAYSRTFCGTCNRLRLTPQGQLQTCLYSDPGLDLREMLRNHFTDEEIAQKIISKVNNRHKNGFEAEKERKDKSWTSMAKIGG
jgi:molybdenum cofactor biosynthesis protein A